MSWEEAGDGGAGRHVTCRNTNEARAEAGLGRDMSQGINISMMEITEKNKLFPLVMLSSVNGTLKYQEQ